MPTLNELLRLINNLIRTGTVASIAAEEGQPVMITVNTGENTTGPIHWVSMRAGASKSWNPPTVGEQVILLSPGGNLEQAIAICSITSTDNPAPSQNLDETVYEFPDGSLFTYNHADHELTIKVNGETSVELNGVTEINTNDNVTINVDGDAEVTATGNAAVNAQAIKLNDGSGVVTGAHICMYTGMPHSHCSSTVFAGA